MLSYASQLPTEDPGTLLSSRFATTSPDCFMNELTLPAAALRPVLFVDLAPIVARLDLDDDTEAHGESSAAPGPWNKVTRSYVYGSDEEEGGDYYNVGKHSAGDAARGEVEMVSMVTGAAPCSILLVGF
jgi:hypothetical protein